MDKRLRKRGCMKHSLTLLMLTLFLLLLGGVRAQATLLTLSTHSSDPLVAPGLLDASLDFSVVGSQLTLAVTNLTPENVGDPALSINEIYFNATGNVEGLVLADVIGADQAEWALSFLENGFLVGGFGEFDVSLVDGYGDVPHVIGPADTVTFIIDIVGMEPFSDTDFTIELSRRVDDPLDPAGAQVLSFAAAKFYRGGDTDISAYGATNIPEPATTVLLGLGGLALLRRRKRA